MKRTRPTILVVDDDPNDLMLIKSAFQAAALRQEFKPQAAETRRSLTYRARGNTPIVSLLPIQTS